MKSALLFSVLLMACGDGSVAPTEHATASLATAQDLSECAQIRFVEAADICHLEGAQARARKKDINGAAAGCQAITQPLWRDECQFLIGEILGRTVGLSAALKHCDQAGRYSKFCYIHLAWWAQPFERISHPSSSDAGATIDRAASKLDAVAVPAQGVRWKEAGPMLRSSSWFSLYYGSGSADPTAARSALPVDAAAARSAFAWEAVRLIHAQEGWKNLPSKVAEVWSGKRPPPKGPSLKPKCWRGRIPDVSDIPELSEFPRGHTVHGGERLLGDSEAADLRIATLEAIFFEPTAPSALWAAGLNDPSIQVQATAARLGEMAKATDAQWRDQLSNLKSPVVRAQILGTRHQVAQVWEASPDREDCP